MKSSLLATFITVSLSPFLVSAGSPSGINNRGSGYCAKGSMQDLWKMIQTIPDTQLYKDKEHIACSSIKAGAAFGGGTCVYLQGTDGANGAEVKLLMQALQAHPNTDGCGSVPMTFPVEMGNKNDLSLRGMLTVNYVADTDNPCPPGVCGATAC